MKTIGIIPARLGSQRLPQKNARLLMDKPLLAWTIGCAHHANTLSEVYVSTEDWYIGILAVEHGCRIIRRPDDLATASATSEDVIRHALTIVDADYVVLLQPTSPFRVAHDIDQCVLMSQKDGETVISYGPNGKNGAIYVCRAEWIKEFSFTDSHIKYEMPVERSVDIDTLEDLKNAETSFVQIRPS